MLSYDVIIHDSDQLNEIIVYKYQEGHGKTTPTLDAKINYIPLISLNKESKVSQKTTEHMSL